MWEWISRVFLDPKSKLFNPDHLHLRSFRWPDIAAMWAKSGFKKQGRQVIGTTFKVQWQSSTGANGYRVQIWSNGAMIREVDITNTEYSYSIEDAKQDGIGRAYTIRVASKNGDQMSTFAKLSISNPVPPLLLNVYTSATINAITVSWIVSEVPDLKDYAVWLSSTPNFDPTQTQPIWTGTTLTTTIGGLQPTTPYYIRVAARDVWENTVWNYTNQISQSTAEA